MPPRVGLLIRLASRLLVRLVGGSGIEPDGPAVSEQCVHQLALLPWAVTDSHRHLLRVGQASCVLDEQPVSFVRAAGFEPAIPSSRTRCSTRLSHALIHFYFVGAAGIEPA